MDGSGRWSRVEELARLSVLSRPGRRSASRCLRLLWNEGVTTAEIGRRIGVSKNAVIGKVHRIGLVPRIVKEDRPRAATFRVTGPACMWPIGHPTDNDFHFCGGRPIGRQALLRTPHREGLYPHEGPKSEAA